MARLAWIVICLCYSLLPLCRSEDPPGHMQPLGSHMEPQMVDRIAHVPFPEEFYHEYMQLKKPVVFEGLLKRTDVLRNWQRDEYLREHFGNDVMSVEEGKKENRSAFARFLSMADFLDSYKEDDIYMVTDLSEGMRKEWMVPRFMLCGGYTTHLMYIYMWFSSGGTKSVLHTDSYENMHCLVSGRKEFVLIEPHYSTVIGPEHSRLGYYHIDVDRVNMTAYPNLTSVPWYKVVVEEGDCLYLPYNWIHHVHSFGRNLGVNVWWIPFEFNAEDCSGDIPEFASLGNFQVTPELQLKNVLKEEEQEDGTVSAEDIHRMMNKHPSLADIKLDTIKKMFELLDPGCEGVIPTSKLDSISLDRYREAFQYIISMGDSMQGMEGGEEGETPPYLHDSDVEMEFTDFGEEGVGSYGNHDYETEEYSEGEQNTPMPPSQQKEEL